MIDVDIEELVHYGTPRHSGRYPWGSGKDPFQSHDSLIGAIAYMRDKGMSETEIAEALGLSTTEYRARKSIARAEVRAEREAQAIRLKDSGMSNAAIAREMGINESSVRGLLDPALSARSNKTVKIADELASEVGKDGLIDIGRGVEQYMGVSSTQLSNSVAVLKEKGYKTYYVKVEQIGTGHETTIKVLAPPGMKYGDVYARRGDIRPPKMFYEDSGGTLLNIKSPISVDSKRLKVRYAEEGGIDMDGTIQLRRGVKDLDLGGSAYAQVRIAVDGTHYLKGMAIYSDKMPPGVDIVFNTNKTKKQAPRKLDALKEMKDDPDNPFGATIRRQNTFLDAKGKRKQGALNIVNEEGDWSQWSKTLSSQMLGKQPLSLVKPQLKKSQEKYKAELDEIMALTNPVVRRRLLQSYSDGADAAASHLKAAALPRQATHVILPFPKMKKGEVYAPGYKNGERVVLVRFPHGGRFEIPELVVNNKNASAIKTLGKRAKDAIGIHPSVAERLSGADFDGDTVLVIPNNSGKVKTAPALKGLANFDPKVSYRGYEGMRVMKKSEIQGQMGTVSNLITDMTIKGASQAEITRAVRHSMVVIDAHKHKLNYKQSEIDNGIPQLRKKYQRTAAGGASTLLSRSNADVRIKDRTLRKASEGGPIDKATGKKVYVETGATYKKKYVAKDGTVYYKEHATLTKAKGGSLVDDLHKISSGTAVESAYADYGNALKSYANRARKAMVETQVPQRSPSARKAYATEVESLRAKLAVAKRNAPRERRAQILANTVVRRKVAANPEMSKDDRKRLATQALAEARVRTNARAQRIVPTLKEWEAIQANAISGSMLSEILDNADLDAIRDLATPKTKKGLSSGQASRAKSLARSGYTQAEIAEALGVSTSTVQDALS